MITRFILFLSLLLILDSFNILAQGCAVQIPNYKDNYTRFVKQLESGNTDIDFSEFRNSFLQSKQYSLKHRQYDSLKQEVYNGIKNKNYESIVCITKAMISIDYTSMFAHKYLQQTYKIVGDSVNMRKYHDIEFGLLHSILDSGDGQSCSTGWHVTQIEEEYFILSMLGVQLQMQSINSSDNNMCDKMVVKTEDGETINYYFEANKVFAKEKELFEGK